MKGYLSVVLHAHLPFVRHVESDRLLEERWLFEALTETYIPLLKVFEGLQQDDVNFRVTMTLTPTLLAMFEDSLLQTRYLKHMNQLVSLSERELERTANQLEFHAVAEHYHDRFQSVRDFFLRCDGDLIPSFRNLQESGYIEILTSAATHAFLPYLQTREAVQAQIRTAVRDYERHLHRRPRGIWLPECGYYPGVDEILSECGLSHFFVGTDAFSQAAPCPSRGNLAPILTESGVAAFARDEASSKQVWSSVEGYPGDYDYREYYRDIGYDLDESQIRPFLHSSGVRHNTGIKYYRITGGTEQKEPYNVEWAREKAAAHAGHFLDERILQIEMAAAEMDCLPIVVAPYDAELFGHWWYEGPQWLDFLFRKLHYDQNVIQSITPSEYLHQCKELQVCRLGMSTWGAGGFGEVWLNCTNDWIYPALHECEGRMKRLADEYAAPSAAEERALNQATRELMLAQSSDFAFIMDHQTMTDYAVKRTKYHINRFLTLHDALVAGLASEAMTHAMTELNGLFPNVDYRDYQADLKYVRWTDGRPHRLTVLMLAWEFPPVTVGGLSRHVYDLSRYLVQIGWNVHVLTTRMSDSPHDELVDGVHVHRVDVLQPDGGEFVHWAFKFNLAMLDRSKSLLEDMDIDVVHAHDWMVCYAAKTLKRSYQLPLIATIHATEHGRNHGIHSPMQHYIHHLEWELTYESARVILCSTYMKREVEDIFTLPSDKLHVIPNGVDSKKLRPVGNHSVDKAQFVSHGESIVLYVGRLVREKGVQVLVEASSLILASCPNTRFVVLGAGPYENTLKSLAQAFQVDHYFDFCGFVSDDVRNSYLQIADVAVFPSLYEPFGIVALEAMAAEIPVVVSDVGGLADVVSHGRNGRKAYPGDVKSLALQVITALIDVDESKRMTMIAKSEMDRFDWMIIARETESVYEQAARIRGYNMQL